MKKSAKHYFEKIDNAPLWIMGIAFTIVWFLPYVLMGEKSVFPIHDQLDETFLAYVLNARHLFDGSSEFAELLNGINKSGLQPSAPLFVLLYTVFSPFVSFVIQYAVVFMTAFFGMYFCVYEIGKSNLISLAVATCFAALPYQPVYGTSVVCVPVVLLAVLYLYQKKKIILSYFLLCFVSVTSHLVLIGYVLLGLWMLFLIVELFRRNKNIHIYLGFFVFMSGYLLMNISLLYELFFGRGGYTSHREEFVNNAVPFWENVKTAFVYGDTLHSPSLHTWLIVPILVGYIIGIVFYRKMSSKGKKIFAFSLLNAALIVCIIFVCGFLGSEPFVSWQNEQTGILHYFSFQRINWVIPFAWYLEAALVLLFIREIWKEKRLLFLVAMGVMLIPTLWKIAGASYLYMNVNQYNNGSEVTGYISWEALYAEELFAEIEEAIGEDMSTYRIAHLGINPAPAIMHGFYTVDGYSNNYSLAYKYAFREVIEAELEKNEYCRVYYDTWGSRVYLFNYLVGNTTFLGKGNLVLYEDLDFDMDALYDLGCRYLFSSSEIVDAEEMNLEFKGYFETENSYWGIWLYQLSPS